MATFFHNYFSCYWMCCIAAKVQLNCTDIPYYYRLWTASPSCRSVLIGISCIRIVSCWNLQCACSISAKSWLMSFLYDNRRISIYCWRRNRVTGQLLYVRGFMLSCDTIRRFHSSCVIRHPRAKVKVQLPLVRATNYILIAHVMVGSSVDLTVYRIVIDAPQFI